MAPSGSSPAAPPADRVEFETLLSDISARLVAVGSDRVEQEILSALEAVRLFFCADRCALCAVTDNLETIRFSHLVHTDDASNLWGDLKQLHHGCIDTDDELLGEGKQCLRPCGQQCGDYYGQYSAFDHRPTSESDHTERSDGQPVRQRFGDGSFKLSVV